MVLLSRKGDRPPRIVQDNPQDAVWTLAWNPDGNFLASAGQSGSITIWDANGTRRRVLKGHQGAVSSLVWIHDAHRSLVSGGLDATIRLWDPQSGEPLPAFQADKLPARPPFALHFVVWNPNGRTMAVANENGDIRLWDVAGRKLLQTMEGVRDKIVDIAWNPDGKTIALVSGSGGGQTVILDVLKGQPVAVLSTGEDNNHILMRDAMSWKPLRALEGNSPAFGLAWSPNGNRLASASRGLAQRGQVQKIAWSPDGSRVASTGNDRKVQLWDAASGKQLQTYQGNRTPVPLAWSPDGKTLAFVAHAGDIFLWNGANPPRKLISEISGKFVTHIAWSPDGAYIATSGTFGGIELWDSTSGKRLRTLTDNTSVENFAWSPNSSTLASVVRDGAVRLWPGDFKALLDQVRNSIRLVSLPPDECRIDLQTESCPPIR